MNKFIWIKVGILLISIIFSALVVVVVNFYLSIFGLASGCAFDGTDVVKCWKGTVDVLDNSFIRWLIIGIVSWVIFFILKKAFKIDKYAK